MQAFHARLAALRRAVAALETAAEAQQHIRAHQFAVGADEPAAATAAKLEYEQAVLGYVRSEIVIAWVDVMIARDLQQEEAA